MSTCKMEKKGAVNGIFMFLTVLIIVGFLLIFGYISIQKVAITQKNAAYKLFQTELRAAISDIKTYSPDTSFVYSSSAKGHAPIRIPGEKQGVVCIIEDFEDLDEFPNKKIAAFASTAKKNVIVYPELQQSFTIENIKTNQNPLCLSSTKGNIEFILTYIGDDEVRVGELET